MLCFQSFVFFSVLFIRFIVLCIMSLVMLQLVDIVRCCCILILGKVIWLVMQLMMVFVILSLVVVLIFWSFGEELIFMMRGLLLFFSMLIFVICRFMICVDCMVVCLQMGLSLIVLIDLLWCMFDWNLLLVVEWCMVVMIWFFIIRVWMLCLWFLEMNFWISMFCLVECSVLMIVFVIFICGVRMMLIFCVFLSSLMMIGVLLICLIVGCMLV